MNLTLQIKTTEEISGLLEEEEKNEPFLIIYPSYHITSLRTSFRVSATKKGGVVKISWQTRGEVDGTLAGIGFTLVAQGKERSVPRGEALISLEDLVKAGKKKTPLLVEIIDYAPTPPEHRTTFEILVTQFSGKLKKSEKGKSFPPLENESERGKELISEFFKFYESHNPKVRAAWNMHIPRFATGFGDMPAAIFRCVRPESKMTEAFAKKILTSSADLNGWTLVDLEEQLKKQIESPKEYYWETNCVAKIIGEAITTTANCMQYSSDTAGKKDVERFKFVRMGFYSGDCEDVAEESATVADSLRTEFVGNDGLMGLVSNFLSRYVIVMVTSLATSPSARESKKESVICHIYTMALPRTYYLEILKKDASQKAQEIMEKEIPFVPWEEGLPVLVLEGTNWCNPLLLPYPLYAPPEHRKQLIDILRIQQEKRQELELSYPLLKNMSWQIQQRNVIVEDPKTLSQKEFTFFYRDVVDMWIADARRYGSNALDFSVGYATVSGHEYGVDFVDLVTKAKVNYEGEKIEILPTYEFGEEDAKAMTRMIDYLPPFEEWTSGGHAKASTKFPDGPTGLVTAKSPYTPNFLVYRTTNLDNATERELEKIKERVEVKTYKIADDGKLNLTVVKIYVQ